MMSFQENTIVTVNPYFSISTINQNSIIIKVEDVFKVLECSYEVLKVVLDSIDGYKSKKELINLFSSEYGEENVQAFLNVLFQEKIIVQANNNLEDCAIKPKVIVLGSGILYSILSEIFKDRLSIVRTSDVREYINNPSYDCETVVVVSECETYGDIIKLNRLLVEKELPFIFVRYNGKGIEVGPYVFPWKTPCGECHFMHHLRALGIDTEMINIDLLNELKFAYPLPDNYPQNQIYALADIMVQEICKINIPNQEFQFVRTEKTLYENKLDFADIKIYQTIADCACCRGMNKKFVLYDGNNELFKKEKLENFIEGDIKYKIGGFRSKDKEETRTVLNRAFDNIGCKIEIKLMEDNPFASVLPVYDSMIKPTHNNKTPYSFGEQISHGKGFDKEQAFFSAAFEIFERMSARYYGDCEVYRATVADVREHAIDIEHLTKQIKNHCTTYDKYSPDQAIDWVNGKSLISGEAKLIPASMAFLTSAVFRGKFFNDTSSGLAAGATKIDAILQGLMELVEHDAWLIGQCNNVQLPLIDLTTVQNVNSLRAIKKIQSLGYKIICRDYTTDIGIPVIRTWIVNPNNFTVYATSGFGASVSPETALERSITEAVQSACNQPPGIIKQYESVNMRDLIYTRDSIYGLYYFQQKDIAINENTVLRSMKDYPTHSFKSVKEMLDEVIQKIRKAIPNSDIVFYDLTRESIGIPVVRTLITGDIQRMSLPLIAVSDRLLKFQENNGYSEKIPTYEELFMGPYPH